MSKADEFYGFTPVKSHKPLYELYGSDDSTLPYRLVIRKDWKEETPILRYFESDGKAYQAMRQLRTEYHVSRQYLCSDEWRG